MGWEHKVRNLYLKWTSNVVFCNTGQNVVHASSKSQWSKLWKLADNIWSVAVKDLTICSRLIRQRFHITLRVISEVYHEYCIKVMKVYLAHNSVWCWPLYCTLYIHVFMMRSFCYYTLDENNLYRYAYDTQIDFINNEQYTWKYST